MGRRRKDKTWMLVEIDADFTEQLNVAIVAAVVGTTRLGCMSDVIHHVSLLSRGCGC